MTDQQDALEQIQHLLESKSSARQVTYKNLLSSFDLLARESKRIITELIKRVKPGDEDVTVDFKQVNEHEFQVKQAGDLLVFVLHTNVVTFAEDHSLMKSDYIKEKEINRYFGQIMIYNFMSDSIKYNRMNDPGYLLARLLINHENRFLVECEGQLGVDYNTISQKPVAVDDLNLIVKLSLKMAIENDLMAPPFPEGVRQFCKYFNIH